MLAGEKKGTADRDPAERVEELIQFHGFVWVGLMEVILGTGAGEIDRDGPAAGEAVMDDEEAEKFGIIPEDEEGLGFSSGVREGADAGGGPGGSVPVKEIESVGWVSGV